MDQLIEMKALATQASNDTLGDRRAVEFSLKNKLLHGLTTSTKVANQTFVQELLTFSKEMVGGNTGGLR